MPAPRRTKRTPATTTANPTASAVKSALATLERLGEKSVLDSMGPRYGIHAKHAFGVRMGHIQKLAKSLGTDHALALALWDTGCYEARLLASFVDDPALVTPEQMDRWARDFDNWAVCDTVAFHLFDKSPHAFGRVEAWAPREEEFVRRGAFALLASLALHRDDAGDAEFLRRLPLAEAAANDARNFVKKGVSWALRGIGHRSPALHGEAVALARRLAASPAPAARWIGKDVLRDITRPLVLRKLASQDRDGT
jgi:3-methyladenine DNA glycosylase AlkD